MGKAYANRKPVDERPESDYYATAYSLTREFLKVESFDKSKSVYEPATGDTGAIAKVLREEGFTNIVEDDIRTTGKDFLKCKDHYDYIITNPPFSLFDDFVIKAKECSDKFAFIMKTNFLGAHSRVKKEIWKNMCRMYVFDRQVDYRTPLREDGLLCVGNLITAFAVWDKNWDKDYFETRIISINKYVKLGSYDRLKTKENVI